MDKIGLKLSRQVVTWKPGSQSTILSLLVTNLSDRIEDYVVTVEIPQLGLVNPGWIKITPKKMIGLNPAKHPKELRFPSSEEVRIEVQFT